MRKLIMLSALLACSLGHAETNCTVAKQASYRVGPNEGFRGVCSNNGRKLHCLPTQHSGWECSGPGGSWKGAETDLDNLIANTCACESSRY